MTLEPIIQLEENLDRLEHTRKCITEYLCNEMKCQCGLDNIRDFINKYRHNIWLENKIE